jgi:uncharacterized protein YhjY with autotransporter beta-barrel domain
MNALMRMRLFKNKNREPGDNKPPYSNSNFTVQERVVLEPGVSYSAGLWRDEKNDALNLRVDEKQQQMQGGGGTPVQPKQQEPEVDIPF